MLDAPIVLFGKIYLVSKILIKYYKIYTGYLIFHKCDTMPREWRLIKLKDKNSVS